jgi:DNA-directed RNA polymerase specialized sigma24 family protein
MDASKRHLQQEAHATAFVTTQWTRVLEARGDSSDARAALSELCGAYYAPVVAFLRHGGHEEDAAREQAHEFFAYLLESDALGRVERGRGRFRSYLLGALKHFLARRHEHAQRQKRGGASVSVPLEASSDASPGLVLADTHTLPPDEFFDRQWALTVLERTLSALGREWAAAGRADDFVQLKPWLTGDAAYGDQAAVAHTLGLSEGALKVAVHRLRRRFRELVKSEVAHTLNATDNVENELQQLFVALGG